MKDCYICNYEAKDHPCVCDHDSVEHETCKCGHCIVHCFICKSVWYCAECGEELESEILQRMDEFVEFMDEENCEHKDIIQEWIKDKILVILKLNGNMMSISCSNCGLGEGDDCLTFNDVYCDIINHWSKSGSCAQLF